MRFRYFIFALVIFAPTVNSEQTLKEVMTPPADSADRENLRIWVPVERTSTCRMTINILNSNGEVIRYLVDALIPHGYHNFYWDKKDDSGRYAFEGEYKYKIKDCVGTDSGTVVVDYVPEEIKTIINLATRTELKFISPSESVQIRVEWYDQNDSLIFVPIDSVVGPGKHTFAILRHDINADKHIKPDKNIPVGLYEQVVIMDGIVYSRERLVLVK